MNSYPKNVYDDIELAATAMDLDELDYNENQSNGKYQNKLPEYVAIEPSNNPNVTNIRVTVGIDKDLEMILKMDPSIIDLNDIPMTSAADTHLMGLPPLIGGCVKTYLNNAFAFQCVIRGHTLPVFFCKRNRPTLALSEFCFQNPKNYFICIPIHISLCEYVFEVLGLKSDILQNLRFCLGPQCF